MFELLRDNPMIAFTVAFVRTRLDPLRARSDRGASAVEWAVIAGICVVMAIAIGGAVAVVVRNGNAAINQGNNLPAP